MIINETAPAKYKQENMTVTMTTTTMIAMLDKLLVTSPPKHLYPTPTPHRLPSEIWKSPTNVNLVHRADDRSSYKHHLFSASHGLAKNNELYITT